MQQTRYLLWKHWDAFGQEPVKFLKSLQELNLKFKIHLHHLSSRTGQGYRYEQMRRTDSSRLAPMAGTRLDLCCVERLECRRFVIERLLERSLFYGVTTTGATAHWDAHHRCTLSCCTARRGPGSNLSASSGSGIYIRRCSSPQHKLKLTCDRCPCM